MSSMMETLQIRKPASLPVSQRLSPSTKDEHGVIRRRLSSLSLNLLNQPSEIASRFPKSKSVSDMGKQVGSSVKEWWEWGWSWILSRKPIFIRDLELNREEAKTIGSQNRGSIMHVFIKLRSQIRSLVGSSSDTLPPSYLNLDDWLHTSPPSDIYVLGFQEIVPLNAGNVLGTEDNGPARKWVSLIRRTLNTLPGGGSCRTPSPVPHPVAELDSDFEDANSSFYHRRSFQSLSKSLRINNFDMSAASMQQPHLDRRFSVCDRFMLGHDSYDQSFRYCSSEDDVDENVHDSNSPSYDQYSAVSRSGSFVTEERDKSKYCLVASKQMVGIFLTVWVKSDLRDSVKNLKVSCVGRGLMGYLGNKGSISISMSVHQTSFCFVCSHLTSGQKEGDELRRNSDVLEILRKTRFPRVNNAGEDKSPQTILEHDRVIWLGDLNYRIALSYRCTKALVEMRNWSALLEKDQLRLEQRKGRVFEGWNEGTIYFPPTYKYSNNSDVYAGDDRLTKAKRRTPAWCDRILWHGNGLSQLSYVRGESRFSDHRPVYSLFSVEIESVYRNYNIKKSSRVEVEELLPQRYGYAELSPY